MHQTKLILSVASCGFLIACVAPPFAFSGPGERIKTSSGTYVVGASPKNPDVWGATFDNFIKSYPDPIEMKITGAQAIEEASGCKVDPDSIEVQQTGYASVWAKVVCP